MDGRLYIDGGWRDGSGQPFRVGNPATGESVGTAANAAPSDATRAVDAAHAAFPAWSRTSATQRAAAMRRISAEMLADLDGIADVILSEQGKPRAQAAFEVAYATEWIDWFAEEGRRAYGQVIPPAVPGKRLHVLRQPVGVAVAITPWNFPLAMIARKLAPALAAGCTMIVKPAEQTPLSAVKLFEAIDRAELPAGVANLVTTEDPETISEALLSDIRVRKITFTGSTEVGKILVRASADHLARVSLELGGQAPFIVFDDADLASAVEGAIASKFQVNGQSCMCANRIYVQDGVHDEFVSMLGNAVKALKVGRGDEEGVDVGPLIDDRAFEKVSRHVEDALAKGARLDVGGGRYKGEGFEGGYFFEPTVLTACSDDMLVAREETFGPVAPTFRFFDESEAIERANDTPYGLSAYVYTRDLGRAMRVSEALESGIVGVNDPRPASPIAPFGGFKESGLGREGSHEGLDEFLETKLVSMIY